MAWPRILRCLANLLLNNTKLVSSLEIARLRAIISTVAPSQWILSGITCRTVLVWEVGTVGAIPVRGVVVHLIPMIILAVSAIVFILVWLIFWWRGGRPLQVTLILLIIFWSSIIIVRTATTWSLSVSRSAMTVASLGGAVATSLPLPSPLTFSLIVLITWLFVSSFRSVGWHVSNMLIRALRILAGVIPIMLQFIHGHLRIVRPRCIRGTFQLKHFLFLFFSLLEEEEAQAEDSKQKNNSTNSNNSYQYHYLHIHLLHLFGGQECLVLFTFH